MASSVDAFTDMDPSPRVTIEIDDADLDGSAHTITVYQLSKGGEFPVRGAVRKATAGGVIVTDYEVPLGIPVAYKVLQYNALGTVIGFASISGLTTQVDVAVGLAVFSDPLQPRNAVLVGAESRFAGTLKMTRPVKTYRAGGKTIAMMGVLGMLEEIPLQVWTATEDDGAALLLILAETEVLIRTMPPMPIPRVLSAVIPEIVQRPFDARSGGAAVVWDLNGSQVSRSEIESLVAVVNYQRFADFYATYATAAAAYSTYLDALRNPPPEA